MHGVFRMNLGPTTWEVGRCRVQGSGFRVFRGV